jgi:hypothetical protein
MHSVRPYLARPARRGSSKELHASVMARKLDEILLHHLSALGPGPLEVI